MYEEEIKLSKREIFTKLIVPIFVLTLLFILSYIFCLNTTENIKSFNIEYIDKMIILFLSNILKYILFVFLTIFINEFFSTNYAIEKYIIVEEYNKNSFLVQTNKDIFIENVDTGKKTKISSCEKYTEGQRIFIAKTLFTKTILKVKVLEK